MAKNKQADDEPLIHETEGSLFRGWPAMLLTVAMVGAAIYSFSPRSYPPFPATEVRADGFLANSVAARDGHYIAVGERGEILYASQAKGPWEHGEIETTRGATLTRVRFVADNTAIAVGHNGWIIRSQDNGKTWQEIQFDAASSDPLLDIGGPYDGKLFVVGSFGQFETSQDLGRSWQAQSLVMAEQNSDENPDGEAGETGELAPENDPESDDYDPFAAFSAGGGVQALANEHFNGIAQAADGSLFIVGERGLLLRSTDGGSTWARLDEIYDGSFYGALVTPDQGLLVYGMRGNAFVSHDNGQSWQQSNIPVQQGLFEGAVTEQGKILLVGASNTVLVSDDNGASFRLITENGPGGLVSLVPLAQGRWLTAGESGVAVMTPHAAASTASHGGDES